MRQRLAVFFSLLLVTAAFTRLSSAPAPSLAATRGRAMPITVWTTEDGAEKAQKVREATETLADAHVNVEEIKSYYWWDDKVNFDPEWRVEVTTSSPFEKVEDVISKVHSYDLPMIIYDLAEVSDGHLYWKGVIQLAYDDAIKLAEKLVEKRIVACAQASPSGLLAVKTMAHCKEKVQDAANGSTVAWSGINGNEGYLKWMAAECVGGK